MKKIITFLGKYPRATTYAFEGTIYSGEVFAAALRQFVPHDQMLVLVTEDARTTTWPVLARLADPRIQRVEISVGESREAVWELLDKITSHVAPGDTVVFDITHGLRSLPFLVFLFAAYLATIRQVAIEHIYYGALELGGPDRPAPVMDLSEYVSMLDWIVAARRFMDVGDSWELGRLMRGVARAEPGAARLIEGAEALERLSHALRLIRPGDAMEASAQLSQVLDAASQSSASLVAARPFTILAPDLVEAYTSFGQPEPWAAENRVSSLAKQRDLIDWYVRREQWVQAVTLAREWLISWVMGHLGQADLLNRELREHVAATISQEAQRRRQAKEAKVAFRPIFLGTVPGIDEVLGDWLALVGVRNDIDHAGMKTSPQPAENLAKAIRTLCRKLKTLPLPNIES